MVRLVAAKSRVVQCVAERKDGWTKARREGFFAMLGATCNVRASAAAMGMNECSAYRVKRRDPAFANQWREALAEGYGRLEQALMALALEGIDPAPAIEAGIVRARDANGGDAKTEGSGAGRRARAGEGVGEAVDPGMAPASAQTDGRSSGRASGRASGRSSGQASLRAAGNAGVEDGAMVRGPGFAPADTPETAPTVTSTITSVDLALRLLVRNADRVVGLAGGRGRKVRATSAETDAALIKQLDALARRIAAEEIKRVGGRFVGGGPVGGGLVGGGGVGGKHVDHSDGGAAGDGSVATGQIDATPEMLAE